MKMATLDSQEPVNLVRSIFLCNLFTFCLSASKACLIPFLTIYLKKLGLTATQTGLIIGAKTLVALVFAPLWSKCSVRCGRRRCVLMFSLFVMSATYLSITAVPSIDEEMFSASCAAPDRFNFSSLTYDTRTTAKHALTTTTKPSTVNTGLNTTTTDTHKAEEQINNSVSNTSNGIDNDSNAKLPDIANPEETVVATKVANITTTEQTPTQQSPNNKKIVDMLITILAETGMPLNKLQNLNEDQLMNLINELLSTESGKKLLSEALIKLPDDVAQTLASLSRRRKREIGTGNDDFDVNNSSMHDVTSESTWIAFRKNVMMQLNDFRDHIRDTENQMFVVVLIILMVGESICSPIEKIADDGWFEFLESIDDLEKYGMQRIWSTFAYILLPVLLTLFVDNTNCLFGLSVHPFMLHFYMFAFFLGLTFLLAFFYPMVTSEKYKYASKVMKGIRVVCCNFRGFTFVITLFIMGMVYSSYYNFLFWLLMDLGSKELTMGVCVSIGALAEIPMLLFHAKFTKMMGNGGIIAISLLCLSARCLYYSFLSSPWAVIPAELCHAFTHTAMWMAVLGSPSFNTSPALSRSIRSILSSVYFGVGFAFGSIVSGVVYDVYGAAVLFQAGSVLSALWLPFLCVSMCCCKEKDHSRVKYARLLNSDDASDDSDSVEDDWLEQALKDR